MKNIRYTSLVLITLAATSSCAFLEKFSESKALPPIDYLENAQKMDIKKFFDGDIEGFAIKQGENGKIIETQSLKIVASWDDNKGVIKKNNVSNDGSKDNRTWLVTLNSDGTIDAVGHDVVSPAKGKQVGNAAQIAYSLMVGDKSGREEVVFEERMYLVSDNEMMMITNFKKKKPDSKKADNKSYGKIITSLRKVSSK
jgi:hypothetical protein